MATGTYSADFQDRIWAFTWRTNHAESQWSDLDNLAKGGETPAAVAQAIDILRRRADREDINPINSWIPHIYYTHLVLQDYLAAPATDPVTPDDVAATIFHQLGIRYDTELQTPTGRPVQLFREGKVIEKLIG